MKKICSISGLVLLLIALAGLPAGKSSAAEESRYLKAVREFADNVLKYGRDTYGPKHTPLFVDGLNIHTHEPVKWIAPNGDRWILSNLASQQNLFRAHQQPGNRLEMPGPSPMGTWDADGPWNHRVLLATSKDGLAWKVAGEVLAEQASVPELFGGPDSRPIVLFVDASGQSERGALGAMVQQPDGGWMRKPTNLRGADPSVVRLKDGTYRAYTKERDGSVQVFSSANGLDWRPLGEAFHDGRYPHATDPDVFEAPSGWVMLISLGPQLLRCTSPDGLKFVADNILDLGGSVSDTVAVQGGWRTFFHVNASPETHGKMLIRSAFTADGRSWRVEESDRVRAPEAGPARLGVADPAPLQLPDGTWIMALKSFIKQPRQPGQFGTEPTKPAPRGEGGGQGAFPPPDGAGQNQPWSIVLPFNELVVRLMSGKASDSDKAELRRLVESLKASGRGPWWDEVRVATSTDGLTFTDTRRTMLRKASVPEAVVDANGNVWLFYVDTDLDRLVRQIEEGTPFKTGLTGIGGLRAARSSDGENFTPVDIEITGAITGEIVDPDIVIASDGTYQLYYLGVPAQELASDTPDPARAPGAHKFYLATSRDLVHWEQEGIAWTGPYGGADPAVYRADDKRYFIIAGGTGQSDDGGRTFTQIQVQTGRWGQPDVIAVNSGFRVFYTTFGGIRSAFSGDGVNWTEEEGTRLRGGADPSVVWMKDGSYRLYYKVRSEGILPRAAGMNFNQGIPGTEAHAKHYAKVNADSDFTPRRGGVSAPGGPAPMRLMMATSTDGLRFERKNLIVVDQGAVPDLVVDQNGWIDLYYQSCTVGDEVNKVALALSKDGGASWTFKRVELSGFSSPKPEPCDPEIQLLPDGTFRLYVTWAERGSYPCTYLTETRDGVHFQLVGKAFDPGTTALDPSILKIGDTWHLFCGGGRGPDENWHGTSKDGKIFTTERTMRFERDGLFHMMANGIAVPDGYRFYGFNNPRPNQPHRINSFFTRDGATWTADSGTRLEDGGLKELEEPAFGPLDPAIGRLKDGTFLMVYTVRIPGLRGASDYSAPHQQPPPPRFGSDERGFAPRGQDFRPEPPREQLDPRLATQRFEPQRDGFQRPGQIRVTQFDSKYSVTKGGKPGRFVTGQEADLMLGGIDFNNTGGPLLFNHPTGLASDGKRLLLTDRWNNRVLIWTKLPSANTPPDLVLGQPNFTANNPGTGRENLNWPGNVTITPDGTKVVVTDTDNDRVLIWNSFPSRNGAPADIVLELLLFSEGGSRKPQQFRTQPGAEAGDRRDPNFHRPAGPGGPMQRLGWPWGVWTDGNKFAIVCTHGAAVLVWNSIPTRDNQPPDLVLRPPETGTPRNITSDGTFFALSDHNHGASSRPATMVWRTFPSSANQRPDFTWNEWVKGTFTPDHKLIVAGIRSVSIWNHTPQSEAVKPDIVLSPAGYRNGDGPDAVSAGGRLYVCNYNGNNVLVWNGLPTRNDQRPDFSLGSDTPEQDTWAENFFITNPVVATDGQSLFVSSDFDRKLHVWRRLPNESGAKPDVTYSLPDAPWDNALHGQTLVLAGKQSVYLWKKLPLRGEQPDVVLSGHIGGVRLRDITGVALDDKHLYLGDRQANRIYVWEGIPRADSEPEFTLDIENPGRLSSDGRYLAAAPFAGQAIHVWQVNELSSSAPATRLGGPGRFNLPGKCVVANGHLFVADTSFNRVQVWHQAEDALAGRPADALLGATNEEDRNPEIGRDKLFMPGTVAFDGSYLWVGEFKFSTRILRFSAQAVGPEKSGGTPLHVVAWQGHKDIAQFLIAKGADVNAKDKQGRTPLGLAERRGHKEIVELLRKHGAKE